MGIIGLIRKKSTILVGVIGASLVFFVASQGIYGLIPILSGAKNKFNIGEIAGKSVSFQEYDRIFNRFKAQKDKQNIDTKNEKEMHEVVWNYLVREIIETTMFEKEYENLGLHVSQEELIDLVQGDHIHEYIKSLFINKNTKTFDKTLLLDYLQLLPNKTRNEQIEWNIIENRLLKLRYSEKLLGLMSESFFLTEADIEDNSKYEYTSLDLNALYIPYSSIDDTLIGITDGMINNYINEHKKEYQTEAAVDIVYAQFEINPSEEDVAEFNKNLNSLVEEFKTAKDNLSFAHSHTDGSEGNTHSVYNKKEFIKKFPSVNKWQKGLIIGPIKENNDSYKIHKLVKKELIKDGKTTQPRYEVVTIEKYLIASDKTRDDIFKKTDYFAANVKKEEFEKIAKSNGAKIIEVKKIKIEDYKLENLDNARPLIKWIFNKGNRNKISPVFEINNKYIVAMPKKYIAKGIMNIEDIRDKVKKQLYKLEKAKLIKEKLGYNTDISLEEIKKNYQNEAKIISIKNLKFENEYIEDIGNVKIAVAKAFKLETRGAKTEPFEDETGVIILELIKKDKSVSFDQDSQKNIDVNLGKQSEKYNVLAAFKYKAKIKNYISKFY